MRARRGGIGGVVSLFKLTLRRYEHKQGPDELTLEDVSSHLLGHETWSGRQTIRAGPRGRKSVSSVGPEKARGVAAMIPMRAC